MTRTAEQARLQGELDGSAFWKRWGPYVSERSWGTVREDYSPNGDAWSYFTHDMARSKAYRWGEDGLAGYCDRYQLLSFSLALWNGKDPILKERAFGVVPSEGNHGEDVKEYYFYLDSTPTHSYMRYLYKYPQAAFPYQQLIEENRRRNGSGPEYELLDTGVFDEDRYFDVFVEFAKSSPDATFITITAHNRGPDTAELHLLPHLLFRNTWSWDETPLPRPRIKLGSTSRAGTVLQTEDAQYCEMRALPQDYSLGTVHLIGPAGGTALFTENETNNEKLHGTPNASPYVKDAFHRHIIGGEASVNPSHEGSKACLHYRLNLEPGASASITLYLGPEGSADVLTQGARCTAERRREADEFYATVHPSKATEDEKRVQRQALAGMLWSKQFYYFDVNRWIHGDDHPAKPPSHRAGNRNHSWKHLNSMRLLSMPDKWEYPWFAAWDLAFHTIALGLVDMDFAKKQLWYLLFEQFLHPNGQIPAYEWEFSDLNPPVHAWAVWRLFNMERVRTGRGDRDFLEKCFHKLLINFTWWINKVDSEGNNIFEGGFLGLDNITVVDRSQRLGEGIKIEQADATGWMGMFCLVLMRIALELAKENPTYEALATKFFQHYVYVGAAMKNMAGRHVSLWDEEDGFFHDIVRFPDGSYQQLSVRSLVGIIPLYAVERLEKEWLEPFTDFRRRFAWFLNNRQDLVQSCCYSVTRSTGEAHVLAVFDQQQLLRLLQCIFDPREFLSDYGVRSLSKTHLDNPFRMASFELRYEPGESECKLKGGNSNWRGPVWFPTSFLVIESLKKLHKAYGPEFMVTLSDGRLVNFQELAKDLAERMIRIFTRNESGKRPVHGSSKKFQEDPHWRDYILFYEYFHADDGSGLGASHQTGWTGLIATLIDEWRQ